MRKYYTINHLVFHYIVAKPAGVFNPCTSSRKIARTDGDRGTDRTGKCINGVNPLLTKSSQTNISQEQKLIFQKNLLIMLI